jgi:hypothetical protein
MSNLQLAYDKLMEVNRLLDAEGARFWIAEDDRHAVYEVRKKLLEAALDLTTLVRQGNGK